MARRPHARVRRAPALDVPTGPSTGRGRPRAPAALAVGAVLLLVTGCRPVGAPTPLVPPSPGTAASAARSGGTTAPTPAASGSASTEPTAAPRSLVALGDSVPAGTACGGCQTYVDLVGARISAATGAPVAIRNDAVPGWATQDVLLALQRGGAVAEDVAGADVVLLTIGANDFDFGDYVAEQCADTAGLGCYQDELGTMRRAADLILDRISALRAGRPTTVVVTGYWNVWQDGQVAESKGGEFVRVARALTGAVNDQLRASATSAGAAYVDLVSTFRGADDADDSPLLAADGDHPNAAGHAAIAAAVLSAVPSLLT